MPRLDNERQQEIRRAWTPAPAGKPGGLIVTGWRTWIRTHWMEAAYYAVLFVLTAWGVMYAAERLAS
ncbi:MAG: hypothetical protein ACRCV9_03550 [Burkholderiaceae bacterium]